MLSSSENSGISAMCILNQKTNIRLDGFEVTHVDAHKEEVVVMAVRLFGSYFLTADCLLEPTLNKSVRSIFAL